MPSRIDTKERLHHGERDAVADRASVLSVARLSNNSQ
jgi:hypothetical protein